MASSETEMRFISSEKVFFMAGYLKNYFINKYGAITDVDFSDIFEKYMNQERK